YHCPHCKIIFGDSRVYEIHMEFHDPTDPFHCRLCGRVSKDGRDFFLHVAQFAHK
ncbi:hypothetical protein HELRODRAFT_148414, partial [Helobdella robusta]|uniref:C2H2-type domain-containing protein n=1 Tax=Helobdella robusta TaxID=6412 RepID=T1EK79_HELRO